MISYRQEPAGPSESSSPEIKDTAIDRFSRWHDDTHAAPAPAPANGRYESLIPMSKPAKGEQYAFEVNLDACTGCKACVVACHSLNGLDETESWREVGLLFGTKLKPYRQTVTTSCHHCSDPACANGCPTLAYDKDPVTGVVKHLDDQCIGCSYCVLKCPYDAPKYNPKRGIVRKCDMCHERLAVGEAPACVQACPNGAIAIRIVRPEAKPAGAMLPGVFDSAYTGPTTTYVGSTPVPEKAVFADARALRVEEGHTPLAFMLVATQAALGAFYAAGETGSAALRIAALLILSGGLACSVLHLGQPLKAWKAVLGWRKSWLSREIIAFNVFAGAAGAAALGIIPAKLAVLAGLPGVFCSIMVYADTHRAYWSFPKTALRFAGTAFIIGAALSGHPLAAAFAAVMKMLAEALVAPEDGAEHRLMWGPLKRQSLARLACGVAGVIALPFATLPAAILLAAGEVLERSLFFRAAAAPRMPGNP